MTDEQFKSKVSEALKMIAEKLEIKEQLFVISQSFNNVTGEIVKIEN